MLIDCLRRATMVTLWDTPLVDYPYIINRSSELNFIYRSLILENRKAVAIEGNYGVGKTFLAKYYAEKYADIYSDGVTCCGNFLDFQSLIEQWSSCGFPTKKHLVVADELTELLRIDSFEFSKFLARFETLQKNSENIDVLLIGKTIPKGLVKSVPHLEITCITDRQAVELLFNSCVSFGIDKLHISSPIVSKIVREANGIPRQILKDLVLYSRGEDFLTNSIETIPGIVDIYGRPLTSDSNEYGKIKIDLSCINEQVLQYLEIHPDDIHLMTPREFEMFTAGLLERMGYKVTLTPQTRDGGVDIFAAKKENLGSFLYLIQCKKHKPTHPVGIGVIRELYGVLQAEKATFASVVTTSYFSPDAWAFQQQFDHQLSLADYQTLKGWLHEVS